MLRKSIEFLRQRIRPKIQSFFDQRDKETGMEASQEKDHEVCARSCQSLAFKCQPLCLLVFFRHVEGLHFTWAALTKRRSGIVVRIIWTRRAAPSLVVISAYAMNRVSIAITDLNSLPITIQYSIWSNDDLYEYSVRKRRENPLHEACVRSLVFLIHRPMRAEVDRGWTIDEGRLRLD